MSSLIDGKGKNDERWRRGGPLVSPNDELRKELVRQRVEVGSVELALAS